MYLDSQKMCLGLGCLRDGELEGLAVSCGKENVSFCACRFLYYVDFVLCGLLAYLRNKSNPSM